jgi:hypothetical protein
VILLGMEPGHPEVEYGWIGRTARRPLAPVWRSPFLGKTASSFGSGPAASRLPVE